MRAASARWVGLLAVALLGSVLVLQRSATALTTDNPDRPGDAAIRTDAAGPLFGGAPLAPGQRTVRCVTVSVGDAPGEVAIRMMADVVDGGLAAHLDVTIEAGTGLGSGGCDGFVADEVLLVGTLADLARHSSYQLGLGAWVAADGERRTYRVTTTLSESAPPGVTANADLHWEARSP